MGEGEAACPAEWMGELTKSMEKPLVASKDMPEELSTEAVDIIVSALDKCGTNYDVASKHIKETMDKKFGPTWHVIIGEGYGFEITHQRGQMLYVYYLGTRAVLLFKC